MPNANYVFRTPIRRIQTILFTNQPQSIFNVGRQANVKNNFSIAY